MGFDQRTHSCGELRLSHVGNTVVLNGWAHRVRDLGGVLFVDMRDRTGIVQLTLDPTKELPEIRSETCLSVTGLVHERDDAVKNAKLATGDIEIIVSKVQVLGQSKALPFPISDEETMETVNEELRVKHRYLDLRRPSMYRKLAIRAELIQKIRNYLHERDFVDLETPIITRSTPEGARDYLVAYRLDPGKWYALPQSPQQYKQLLMVAGFERYYQIAKCFRDESQRADRQPEFTQLDLEMSFVTQDDVLELCEGLTVSVVNDLIDEFKLHKDHVLPFRRLTYQEALSQYGSDKPDLRFGLHLFEVTDELSDTGFSVFKNVIEIGGVVRGVRYPHGSKLSRKDIGALEELCKQWGAKGMATLIVENPGEGEHAHVTSGGLGIRGSVAKALSLPEIEAILKKADATAGDLICLIADGLPITHNVLGRLRLEVGERSGLRDPRKLAFCWVVDFPLVEWDEDTKSWTPSHHPFTSPKDEDLHLMDSDPGKVRADCYDMVCNGLEMASGSIRIHRTDVQARIFTMLGIDEKTQRERFGHMLDAFSYGAPPHGGIAPGIDRLVMILNDTENIREVIAFPKMGNGYDPMMDAPSTIDLAQWKELGLTPPKK